MFLCKFIFILVVNVLFSVWFMVFMVMLLFIFVGGVKCVVRISDCWELGWLMIMVLFCLGRLVCVICFIFLFFLVCYFLNLFFNIVFILLREVLFIIKRVVLLGWSYVFLKLIKFWWVMVFMFVFVFVLVNGML